MPDPPNPGFRSGSFSPLVSKQSAAHAIAAKPTIAVKPVITAKPAVAAKPATAAQPATHSSTPASSSPSSTQSVFSAPPSARTFSTTAPSPFITSTNTAPPATATRASDRLHHSAIFDFGTKVLTIRVGKEPAHTDFTVHEALLTHSSYLREIHHAASSYICLPEQKTTAFNVYVQWLYTRDLYTRTRAGKEGQPEGQGEWHILIDAYLLGRKLRDEEFQDRVMDGIAEWLKEVKDRMELGVMLQNVADVYADAEDHALRRFVSDVAAMKFPNEIIQKVGVKGGGKEAPWAFLVDVLVKMSARFQGVKIFGERNVAPEMRGVCWYHRHGEGACYREK